MCQTDVETLQIITVEKSSGPKKTLDLNVRYDSFDTFFHLRTGSDNKGFHSKKMK